MAVAIRGAGSFSSTTGATVTVTGSSFSTAPVAGDLVVFVGAQSHDETGDNQSSNVSVSPSLAAIVDTNFNYNFSGYYASLVSWSGQVFLGVWYATWASGASYSFNGADSVQFVVHAFAFSGASAVIASNNGSALNWTTGTATSATIPAVTASSGDMWLGVCADTSSTAASSYGAMSAATTRASVNYVSSDGTRLATGYKSITSSGSTGTTTFSLTGGQNALSVALKVIATPVASTPAVSYNLIVSPR